MEIALIVMARRVWIRRSLRSAAFGADEGYDFMFCDGRKEDLVL
jgi:hypothetical protein